MCTIQQPVSKHSRPGTQAGEGEADTKQLVQHVKEMFDQPTTHNNSNISELTVAV